MRSLLMLLMLAAIGIHACTLFDDDDDYLVRTLGALDVDVTDVGQHRAVFRFHSQTPDPCYERYFDDVEQSGHEVLVTVHARRKKSLICACVVTDVVWPIDVAVPASGTYLFRFWQSDSTTVDTTLTIP